MVNVTHVEAMTMFCCVSIAYVSPTKAARSPKMNGKGGNNNVDFLLYIKYMDGNADKFINWEEQVPTIPTTVANSVTFRVVEDMQTGTAHDST